MFNSNALVRLAERTEYEAWFLEAVYAIADQELFPSSPNAVVCPVGKRQAQYFVHARGNIVIGDWWPGFLKGGAPLSPCIYLQGFGHAHRVGS